LGVRTIFAMPPLLPLVLYIHTTSPLPPSPLCTVCDITPSPYVLYTNTFTEGGGIGLYVDATSPPPPMYTNNFFYGGGGMDDIVRGRGGIGRHYTHNIYYTPSPKYTNHNTGEGGSVLYIHTTYPPPPHYVFFFVCRYSTHVSRSDGVRKRPEAP